jgi:ubiquinone/menaquinone biosynthesis C-methylase UbiE
MKRGPKHHDASLFAGTASYYSRYRFPYPQPLFDYLSRIFGFDRTGMALDLGCGPGLLTLPLAPSFGKIVAMDPDEEMMDEAQRAANTAGLSNIEFVKGSSWELSPVMGEFRFVIMGQSFHWMERAQVLSTLYDMLEFEGGLAIVNQERRAPAAITHAEDETVKKFLGDRRRAGQGYYEHPPESHEVILARSRFGVLTPWHYRYQRAQTVHQAIGMVFSTSRATRQLLGDRAEEFEAELRRRFMEAAPGGTFKLDVDVTALLGRKE